MTVIIPTKERPADLQQALASIAQQAVPPAQVVIVDASAQRADEAALARALAGGARVELVYLWMPASPGLTAQKNAGAAAARGSLIQFLDDDATLDPEYFLHLLPIFADERVGGAAGLVIDPALGRNPLKRRFFRLFHWGAFRQIREEAYLKPPAAVTSTNTLPGVSAYRADIIRDLQFDERLTGPGLGEDIDFSYRAGRQWRLLIEPRARLFHRPSPRGRQTIRRNFADKVAFYHYHFRKNMRGGPLEWLAYAWLNVGFMLDALARVQIDPWLGLGMGWRAVLQRGLFYRPSR